MKSKFGREITLLLLPFVAIAGAALWKGRAPSLLAFPRATPIPRRGSSLNAGFRIGTLQLLRLGPVNSQNRWRDEDFTLSIPIETKNIALAPLLPSASPARQVFLRRYSSQGVLIQLLQYGPPHLGAGDGAPVNSTSSTPLIQQFQHSATWPDLFTPTPTPLSSPPPTPIPPLHRFTYTLDSRFDLDRVPAARGVVEWKTSLVSPDAKIRSMSALVRPQWFFWAPQTLYLVSRRTLPAENGDDGGAELLLRSTSERPLSLAPQPEGSSIKWKVQPRLDGKPGQEFGWENKLLYNWSPRFESRDGKYNSHTAKDAYGWMKYRARFAPTTSRTPLPTSLKTDLDRFRPAITAQNPIRVGELIRLRFRFAGLKAAPQARRFVTEIGVPGDGFLKVSVPLRRK